MDCQEAFAALQSISEGKDVRLASSDLQELKSLKLVSPADKLAMDSRTEAELRTIRTRLSEINADKNSLNRQLAEILRLKPNKLPGAVYKKDPSYRSKRNRLSTLESEEKNLRTKFIDLSQRATEGLYRSGVSGEKVSITYGGREVIGELEQRIDRVASVPLKDFVRDINEVKAHFQRSSAKARKILKKISPKFPSDDEIHFRSVAVGLSGRRGDFSDASELFIRAYRRLRHDAERFHPLTITLAESLALIAKDRKELDQLVRKSVSLINRQGGQRQAENDWVRAISIILSSMGDVGKMMDNTERISERYCPEWPSVAAFLATQYHIARERIGRSYDFRAKKDEHPDVIFERFVGIRDIISEGWTDDMVSNRVASVMASAERLFDELMQRRDNVSVRFVGMRDTDSERRTSDLASNMAAALMASSDRPINELMQRYQEALERFRRFSLGNAMYVPAAMVAILPVSVDEAMDNLRLAAATISANRLSLGGMENLSLGMKLLMRSATVPVGPPVEKGVPQPTIPTMVRTVPPVLTIAGISIASALALGAGVLAFHEFSLHRTAVSDFVFHPVHMHYVYG